MTQHFESVYPGGDKVDSRPPVDLTAHTPTSYEGLAGYVQQGLAGGQKLIKEAFGNLTISDGTLFPSGASTRVDPLEGKMAGSCGKQDPNFRHPCDEAVIYTDERPAGQELAKGDARLVQPTDEMMHPKLRNILQPAPALAEDDFRRHPTPIPHPRKRYE